MGQRYPWHRLIRPPMVAQVLDAMAVASCFHNLHSEGLVVKPPAYSGSRQLLPTLHCSCKVNNKLSFLFRTDTTLISPLVPFRGNDQTLRELTSDTYQDQVLLMRKKQKRDCKYIWHFHKEVTPARVLSIRATQGYLAQENPKFGNRYIIQAIVRIDTEQVSSTIRPFVPSFYPSLSVVILYLDSSSHITLTL